MKCLNCGIEFDARADAKFCSPKCRVTFSRKQSIVTDNVTVNDPDVTDNFEYSVPYNSQPGDEGYDEEIAATRAKVKTAKYWYDVPIAAIPVIKKGWPKIPVFERGPMNGRQYFLWWKNEFKVNEDGQPIILNPGPKYDNVTYYKAGEGSRRWGA